MPIHYSNPTCDICGERHADGHTAECRDCLLADRAALAAGARELVDEKERRIYYQDIVYDICNLLDTWHCKRFTVCGTVSQPSTNVQKEVKRLILLSNGPRHESPAMKAAIEAAEALERALGRFETGRCLGKHIHGFFMDHTFQFRENLAAALAAVKEEQDAKATE